MFNKSFDDIMDEMKLNVPTGMDVSEGSILYDALAPMALALEKAYMDMDSIIELAFAETSNGKYLSMRAEEFGVSRKEAKPAEIEGKFNIEVPKGSQFYIDGLYFTVSNDKEDKKDKEEKEDNEYRELICDTPGKIHNIEDKNLIPINNMEGLTIATVSRIESSGEDEESDEALLKRLHHKVRNPITSGNIGHYKLWANSVNGVGDCRVIPKHDGVGTVKIIVIDNNKQPLPNPDHYTDNGTDGDDNIVKSVKTYIDKVRPIGVEVTVEGAIPVKIDIQCSLKVSKGINLKEIKDTIVISIEEYLKSIAFKVDEVRYSRILNNIFQIEEIEDCINLQISCQDTSKIINNNIILNFDEVAVLGQVTFHDS